MNEREQVPALLSNAYESLRNVDIHAAAGFLDRALELDFEHPEVLYAMKCARYWQDRLGRIQAVPGLMDRGDVALAQWKSFSAFASRLPGNYEHARFAFKRFVFGMAMEHYLSLPDQEKADREPELEFRLGRCRKACGDFDTAVRHLEKAARAKRDDPRILAELADCHALSGEQRLCKALFREAFYLGAAEIDVDLLESDLIRSLADKVAQAGYEGQQLREWMPVYGKLSGVFSVKRDLTPAEAARLDSSVRRLENDLRENASDRPVLLPRLLNRYFWLIDHLMAAGAEREKTDAVLLKIRLLDPEIHRQYIA